MQSENIVDVWPAYRYEKGSWCNEDSIIFVVITKGQTKIETEYQIYERNINEISSLAEKENSSISEEEKLLTGIEAGDLTQCLKSNAEQMMTKHSNLTWITMSGIKSTGFGNPFPSMTATICAALYVQIKGFIPIEEDPFEPILDRYPIDVREGVFRLCGSPTDLHQHVRMGCALDSGFGTQQGTIGPFCRFDNDPCTYLLTSAHVLLDPQQMRRLLTENQVHYGKFGTDSYQPPESMSLERDPRYHLGKTEFAVYRKGGQYTSGMEIALVRIDNSRVPKDGQFPDVPNLHSECN